MRACLGNAVRISSADLREALLLFSPWFENTNSRRIHYRHMKSISGFRASYKSDKYTNKRLNSKSLICHHSKQYQETSDKYRLF